MKQFFLSGLLACFVMCAIAQSPQAFNYQAIARNINGNSLPNQSIAVRFTLKVASNTGAIVYQERDTATTNQFGLFTTEIGRGAPLSGTFAGVNWASGAMYLDVEFDPSGGNTFTDLGTTQLISVPYALFAQQSGSGPGNAFIHYIGQLYQGGIVVSVWKDSTGAEHGLITSLTNLVGGSIVGDSVPWSNVTSTLIGVTAQSPSNGSANTSAIIGQAGQTSSAALLCRNYNAGGYSDWYLPSAGELVVCYNALAIVNKIIGDTNGFMFQANYWSSTEHDASNAYDNNFLGTTTWGGKAGRGYVRAVRAF